MSSNGVYTDITTYNWAEEVESFESNWLYAHILLAICHQSAVEFANLYVPYII